MAGGECKECQKKQRLALQTKLTVNEPGDIYEQEADRISEQVMRMPEPQLQRAFPCGGGSPKCQSEQPGQEHKRLQTKRVGSRELQQTPVPPIVHEVLRSPGQPLDTAARAFMEPRFGHDFSHVRIHTDAQAAESAREVNALAYTVGSHIVFGKGQSVGNTTAGQHILAHELTHVVQQSGTAPVAGGESAGSSATVAQRSPTPEIMRSPLFNSTMKICRRVLESRGFAITEGGLKVTTFARWQPSDEWQGTDNPECGKPEFHITLVRDDPVFDNDWGDCTFPMGVPFSRQWTDLSTDDDWYLTIWTNNTNPNCCLEGSIEVAQERGLSGESCTKPPPGPLEILHSALDVAGMLPFLGAFPDAINAGIYAIEGDWDKAGLSAVAAVPVFGDATKGASLVYRGGKEAVQVSGDVVQRAGKDKIAKGLDDARAASKPKPAAAAEAKMPQKELGAGAEATSAEKELVGEGFIEGPAKAVRPGRAPKTGLGKAARKEFEKVRDGYAKRLGVPAHGQVHHAIELQTLDRYPGVHTATELNAFENMRGINTELARRQQLHGSKVREIWDRHYARMDREIAAKGLKPGTAEYNEYVKRNLQDGRDEMDYVLGQFFTEYRTGKPRSFK